MSRFLIHRGTIALLVAITVSIIGFSLLRMSGDLATVLAGDNAKPEQIAQVAHLYGLDRPMYDQYLDWAVKALSGDLGRSLFSNEPVARMIGERIGVTLQLSFMALVFAIVLAVPLGVMAATRPNSLARSRRARHLGVRPGDPQLLVRADPDHRLRASRCAGCRSPAPTPSPISSCRP